MLRVKVLVVCRVRWGEEEGTQGPSIGLLGCFQADSVGQV